MVADTPPTNQTDHDESEKPTAYRGYRGKFGLIKTNIVSTYGGIGLMLGGIETADGRLFLQNSEPVAEAWIAWGKADERYMRVVQTLWGGPWMVLFAAHTPIVFGMMGNHGVKVPRLFNPLAGMGALRELRERGNAARDAARDAAAGATPSSSPPQSEPQPLPYQPVGAYAPTTDAGPPQTPPETMRVYPDEGLTSEEETAIRNAARQLHKPYEEVRGAYLLARTQDHMATNGQARAPGTLGAPVMRE